MSTILLMLLLTTQVVINSLAQEMPLVYDVENTGAGFPAPYMFTVGELPSIQALPDPFKWADGRGRISNFSDWSYRREEIKYQIEHYEIGEKPDRPDNITASFTGDTLLTVKVYLNDDSLILTSKVTLPAGEGPFPAVIGMVWIPGSGGTGAIPADIFTSRNIATIEYVHDQVTSYAGFPQLPPPSTDDPYYRLYPNLNLDNTGQYSAWAWGVSRLIDGLELVQEDCPINLKHLAVTGCSYAGKMALFAGAFDERVALTIAQESGGGGAPAWRVSETLGSVEKLGSTDHNWFRESMFDFAGTNVPKLPEDHHELMAMCAPRALLVTGNTNYEWLANPSCYVSAKATQEVYNALGIGDRFGFYIDGGHNHCAIPESQRPAIEAFVDKFLLGDNNADTDVAVSPYSTDLSPWITWTNPTLSNDSSYFGRTSLIYPSNLQTNVDSSVTFLWHRVEGTDKYYFQLSTNPTFKTLTENDSLTDTLIIVSDFLKGTKYYWRVQVKNTDGDLGPWSEYWNFVTFIPLPAMPELISATTFPKRSNYIQLMWRKVEYAAQYRIQISRNQTFSPLAIPTATTSDTVITLSGLVEGQKYYWRVQAENIAGPGPWSDTPDFTIIVAPTDLVLQITGSDEITLTWTDNSSVEDGYVIERKQSPDTVYSVLDTLKGSGNEYTDTNLEQGQTYTYRVKAYKDSAESDYSNEASLILVGIKEQKEIPTKYSIDQNYPNPFNPTTKIKFALPKTALTKIIIYDLLGREIKTLISKELEAGYHEINLDANNLTSGIYFYRIQSGDFISTKKMMLMK
jgi:hypothetical protein